MGLVRVLFGLGVLLVAAGMGWSPWPWCAPLVVGLALVWAAYDLVDVKDGGADGDSPTAAPPWR